jgi:hypothetical protein
MSNGLHTKLPQKFEKDNTLLKIEQSIVTHPYSVGKTSQLHTRALTDRNAAALDCPGLRHFVYKSRQNVQITSPMWEAPYDDPEGSDCKR